jgi:hypothetical protein
MNPVHARRQRGIALLALLAVIALSASWFVVSRLNNNSNSIVAANRNRNAAVLNRAKQTLIGYIAQQAAENTEDNPGRLPCPEAPGSFDNATTEGIAAGNCTLPAVGRFPWRTLGMDRLVDSAGEPLWYVVSPGWALPSAGATLVINSNTAGQLQVDGAANDSVALIIAPGPAFSVPAAAGCTAWNQTRPTTGTPDWRNYLECENATNPADATFVTTGPSGSFNDQVVRITVADVLPAIEAAIAHRIERDVAPAIQSMYSGGSGTTSWSGSPSAPAMPFPAAFTNPSTSTGQGSSALLKGLLPLVYAETTPGSGTLCTGGSAPRCSPTFVQWSSANMSGSTGTYSESCTTTTTQINCTFYYRVCTLIVFCGTTTTANFTVNGTASNVGMAMRQLNTSTAGTSNVSSISSISGVLNTNGSATIAINGSATVSSSGTGLLSDLLCSITGFLNLFYGCKQSTLSIPITVFADHPLLNSAGTGAASLGWFLRNKWNEVSYYTIAAGFAPSGSRSCITNSTCLYATYHSNNGKLRGLIALSGRSLTGATRPNATLTDWFEGSNATATGSTALPFQVRSPTLMINRTFNDRIAVLGSN